MVDKNKSDSNKDRIDNLSQEKRELLDHLMKSYEQSEQQAKSATEQCQTEQLFEHSGEGMDGFGGSSGFHDAAANGSAGNPWQQQWSNAFPGGNPWTAGSFGSNSLTDMLMQMFSGGSNPWQSIIDANLQSGPWSDLLKQMTGGQANPWQAMGAGPNPWSSLMMGMGSQTNPWADFFNQAMSGNLNPWQSMMGAGGNQSNAWIDLLQQMMGGNANPWQGTMPGTENQANPWSELLKQMMGGNANPWQGMMPGTENQANPWSELLNQMMGGNANPWQGMPPTLPMDWMQPGLAAGFPNDGPAMDVLGEIMALLGSNPGDVSQWQDLSQKVRNLKAGGEGQVPGPVTHLLGVLFGHDHDGGQPHDPPALGDLASQIPHLIQGMMGDPKGAMNALMGLVAALGLGDASGYEPPANAAFTPGFAPPSNQMMQMPLAFCPPPGWESWFQHWMPHLQGMTSAAGNPFGQSGTGGQSPGYSGGAQGSGGHSAQGTDRTRNASPPADPLVKLKPGGSRRPLFLIHAAMGSVFPYHKLALNLDEDQPCYGIQARGLDGKEAPRTRIEEMAQAYIQTIKRVQPRGPYNLGGYSFGGWVAYEMARQLAQQGESVQLLAILGSGAPPSLASPHLYGFLDFYLRYREDYDRLVNNSFHDEKTRIAMEQQYQTPPGVSPMKMVADAAEQAQYRYVPGPYHGPIDLFYTSEQQSPFPHDQTMGWRILVSGTISNHPVAGTHLTIFADPDVRDLAQKLSQVLRRPTAG